MKEEKEQSWPKEFFVPLEFEGQGGENLTRSSEDFLMGRFSLFEIGEKLRSEVDLIWRETGKIEQHLGAIESSEGQEALIAESMQFLSFQLKNKCSE